MEKQYRFAGQRQEKNSSSDDNKNRHFVREFEQTRWHLHSLLKSDLQTTTFLVHSSEMRKTIDGNCYAFVVTTPSESEFKFKWIWDTQIVFEILLRWLGVICIFLTIGTRSTCPTHSYPFELIWHFQLRLTCLPQSIRHKNNFKSTKKKSA